MVRRCNFGNGAGGEADGVDLRFGRLSDIVPGLERALHHVARVESHEAAGREAAVEERRVRHGWRFVFERIKRYTPKADICIYLIVKLTARWCAC
mmetsp:Transcript_11328/g.24154  ORF Transcript_11328/g.24154 Transcript_11328/m.24154 type:complete len:95 (+) Transcript_11328:1622-1906(+)